MVEERQQDGQDKNRGRAVTVARAVWNKWRNKNAQEKIKALIQTTVVSAVSVGSVIGVVGYANASDAQDQLKGINIDNPIIIPADWEEEVAAALAAAEAAQVSADEADAKANEAYDSAIAAGASAEEAQASAQSARDAADAAQEAADSAKIAAEAAQETANIALAAVPKLGVFPPQQVDNNVGVYDDPPAGEFTLQPGTYVIEWGYRSNLNSQGKIVFSNGVVLPTSTTSGFRTTKALVTFDQETTGTIYFDPAAAALATYDFTDIYVLTTKVQGL